VCPGNKQSAGKRLSGRTTRGNVWLRAMLVEAAWTIARTRGSYLHAQSHRIARRRGKPKAVVAVAHGVLVIVYHLLRTGRPYADLGADSFERRDAARLERYHVRRLEQLGYAVTLASPPAA
jgi:transposase